MGVWRQIILMFFANFPVSCCRDHPPAFSYGYGYDGKCHLSLAYAIFLQDLDACLAYKHPLGIYWVLYWIFLMKRGKKWRNELNWKIDPDRCHAIFTSRWSRAANTSAWIFLSCSCSFPSLLEYNVFVLVFCNFLFVISSLFRRRVLCMHYFESVVIHATHLLFPFSSDCATN